MLSTPLARRGLGVEVAPVPTSPSIARSLLVSRDARTIDCITSTLSGLAVATDVCVDPCRAAKMLHTRKFDAVIVDFNLGEHAPGLLGEMRLSTSNRTAPAIAIVRDKFDLALAHVASSNLILQRPLVKESLLRTLNAGYGLIMRERRRYFRCHIKTPILVRRIDMREKRCHIVNISEGGVEISSAPPKLVPGARLYAEFGLPQGTVRIKTVCETRWRNGGHAGLQFLLMPLEQRCDLQEWLAARLEDNLPESVAEMFRMATARFHFADEHAEAASLSTQ